MRGFKLVEEFPHGPCPSFFRRLQPLTDAFLRIRAGGNVDLVHHRPKICSHDGIVLQDVLGGALAGASDTFRRGTDRECIIVFLVPAPFDLVALQAGDGLIHFDIRG